MIKLLLFTFILVGICHGIPMRSRNRPRRSPGPKFQDIIKINKEGKSGLKFLEGDMVKTEKLESTIARMKAASEGKIKFAVSNFQKWPKVGDYVIVPYKMSKKMPSEHRKAFEEAVSAFKKHTCVKFVPRESRQEDYLYIHKGDGCWSYVGIDGGKQMLSLGDGCEYKGTAIHEMMHAIGFFHEQSRQDRNQHVKINYANIEDNQAHNFDKYQGEGTNHGLPYDKESIMHYGNYDFSKNEKMTIQSLSDPEEVLGREKFSKYDIQGINKHYGCTDHILPTVDPELFTTTESPDATPTTEDTSFTTSTAASITEYTPSTEDPDFTTESPTEYTPSTEDPDFTTESPTVDLSSMTTWMTGGSSGGSHVFHGYTQTREECLEACQEMSWEDTSINGVTYNYNRSRCHCVSGMTGTDYRENLESAYLPESYEE